MELVKEVYYVRDDNTLIVRIKYKYAPHSYTEVSFNADNVPEGQREWYKKVLKCTFETVAQDVYNLGKREVKDKLKDAFDGVF